MKTQFLLSMKFRKRSLASSWSSNTEVRHRDRRVLLYASWLFCYEQWCREEKWIDAV